jgi:predicted NAD/FAD-binding protein
MESMNGRVHLKARIQRIDRDSDGVRVIFEDRPPSRFDEAVLACHGDQVLPLLGRPSDRERDVFGRFRTSRNEIVVHTDGTLLPARPRARASWNYLLGEAPDAPPTVTYDLNRLQRLEASRQFAASLNPRRPIEDSRVIARLTYEHPLYTRDALQAQARWNDVSGCDRIHYCGAYWFYGFHEDGLRSAIRVAGALGIAW